MKISAIAAVAKNNVIGFQNSIPWYLPADFKYFKKVTTGHPIIMGRSCYESIGKPLPQRTNIIVTRDVFYLVSGCVIVHSIDEALMFAEDTGTEEAFIIGGGQVYSQTVHLWDKLYLTEVDLEPQGDIYFPSLDLKNEWHELSREAHPADDKNEHDFTFVIYERKT